MKKILIYSIFIFIVAGLWFACSENKNPLPSKSHPESWTLKSSPDFHGKKVLEVGFPSCMSCHGSDFQGGESKISCFQCHEKYPHIQGVSTTPGPDKVFHEEYLDDPTLDTKPCQSCHGDDYRGGRTGISCYTCHDNFPHVENWLTAESPESHGGYLKSESWSLTSCAGCHGTDYQGGKSNVSCYHCHSSYPHVEDWLENASESFHGEFLENTDWDLTACQKCHGLDHQGGSSEVACFTCHENYPHNDNWLITSSIESHGQYLKDSNWSLTGCQNCHGIDYQGGESKVSCFTCHSAYPHIEGWLETASESFHGEFLNKTDWNLTNCQNCHGVDHLGGTSEVSCFTCHDSYPHAAEWMTASSIEFHGQYIQDENWSLEKCQSCHGVEFEGGSSEISCFQCHTAYPHLEGWETVDHERFHGQNIREANWSMSTCQNCHGVDYMGGISGSSCYQCHQSAGGPEACNTCHGNALNHAPPQDLNNNIGFTAIGVGAHQVHVVRFGGCQICHQEPTSFSDPAHIDDTPYAEVNPLWSWDHTTATCVTGCHLDSTKTYIWNDY